MKLFVVQTRWVPVLLCVAFLTLAERGVLASMQRRAGPEVSGFGGISGVEVSMHPEFVTSVAKVVRFLRS